MAKKNNPAQGDKIDLGGKIPQFDTFAWLAYHELTQQNLDWIRIADPKALKLDDVQYATHQAIHAYQIKWSSQAPPVPFSYTDLLHLVKDLAEGWKALTVIHAGENKPVIPHLLSNRPRSSHDSIKEESTGSKVGSFDDFYTQVWLKLKTNTPIASSWQSIADNFKNSTGLDQNSFEDFVSKLELQFKYKRHVFGIGRVGEYQQNKDLKDFSRFLLEEIAYQNTTIQYSKEEIVIALDWTHRLKTTFNHELIIDKSRYQPISETIGKLNQNVEQYLSGYIFLVGGPGSGKSTLLTEWSRTRKERIIRYYAFDFTNPSSSLNHAERGAAVSLYFDLVFQLNAAGVNVTNTILQKNDLGALREVFAQQLDKLGKEFQDTGRRTIIIIDGLDHVTREYKPIKSFLSELIQPKAIPNGVNLVLGSQTYDLEALQLDVELEWKSNSRTVKMDALNKKEAFAYINASELELTLNEDDKEKVYEISQGHPLFLSYLISKLKTTKDLSSIKEFQGLNSDIGNYYSKIWKGVAKQSKLIDFFGLICRIKGKINPEFVLEWGTDENILLTFRQQAIHLFDVGDDGWVFFHNSFRQFLISETALNPLLNNWDNNKNFKYHRTLAHSYSVSIKEESWHAWYHLFHSEDYLEFLKRATPESFIEQLQNYRPVAEIRDDIRLGLEVGKLQKDIYIVIQYLFASSELERRLYNLDPASFVKDFLLLGKNQVVKRYLRNSNQLLCSKKYAYQASRWFYQLNDKVEAKILYSLAEPEAILPDRLFIDGTNRYDELHGALLEWALTAPLFEPLETILYKIDNIEIADDRFKQLQHEYKHLKEELLNQIAELLADISLWDDFNLVLNKFDLSNENERDRYFLLLHDAIETCLDKGDQAQAELFLNQIIEKFERSGINNNRKIAIADIIFKAKNDIELIEMYLEGITQPDINESNYLDYDNGLDDFLVRIKLNKLLNIIGKEQTITKAVPDSQNPESELIIEFERMLFLITQILCDGLLNKQFTGDIIYRVMPIIRFHYKSFIRHNRYWHKLIRAKSEYFRFLVFAVFNLGFEQVDTLMHKLIGEFSASPMYWPSEVKRDVLMAGLEAGFSKLIVKEQLLLLENDMLKERDVDGKVTECKKHVKAWIKLEESVIAEKWIKKAIQYSTGVGYRKDYQFDAWIEWLQKVNPLESDKAGERIRWFLSKLQQIKDTTEGAAFHSAANTLMCATFKFNSYWGFQQMMWQLDNGLIQFIQALEAAIEQCIENVTDKSSYEQVQDIFLYLIVYIAEFAPKQLFKKLLQKGYSLFQDNYFQEQIPIIINHLKVRAIEENRKRYYQLIHEFLSELNLKAEFFNYDIPQLNQLQEDEGRYENELTILPDNQKLHEDVVRSQITSFEAFNNLLLKEAGANSSFDWSKVVDTIMPFLTVSRLKKLLDIRRTGNSRDVDLFAAFSKCALQLHDANLAKSFAYKALNSSSSLGWQKYYDGGTRLIALDAYQLINPSDASNLGFTIFTDDAIHSKFPGSYIEHLDDILPLVTTKVDVKKSWEKIDNYLKRLMDVESAPVLPPAFKMASGAFDLSSSLLLYLCKHEVSFIHKIAKEITVRHLQHSTQLEVLVKALVIGKTEEKELFTELMLLLSTHYPSNLLLFDKEIRSLYPSRNFFIHTNAEALLKTYTTGFVAHLRPQKELNFLYSLELKVPHSFTSNDPIEEHGYVKDTDNPLELIKPFGIWLDILSKKTGIEKTNLAYRWKALMQELSDPFRLTSEYEQQICIMLKNIDLNYAYPRPRVVIAQRALMFLVNELCDARELLQSEMVNLLKFYDYSIDFFVKEVSMPFFVQSLNTGDRSSLPKNWILQSDQNSRLNEEFVEYESDWFLIGEYSLQRSLEWGLATQTYMMNFSFNRSQSEKEKHEIFAATFGKTIESYYTVDGFPGEPNILVINDNMFYNFDLKTKWLAFNTNLAYFLGWKPDLTNMFGWKNEQGELMAKSVFWLNGNMKMDPPKLQSEAGEGWFVIVSGKALTQLKNLNPVLKLKKRIIREKTSDGKKEKQVHDMEKMVKLMCEI